jgi:ribosomal protein L11 methyltransferase
VNGIAATFVLPDALAPGSFDIVVANILANPLTLLAPALALRVRAGGHLALSGILAPQADAVAAAYARWFTIESWKSRDGWVLLAGERRGGDEHDR